MDFEVGASRLADKNPLTDYILLAKPQFELKRLDESYRIDQPKCSRAVRRIAWTMCSAVSCTRRGPWECQTGLAKYFRKTLALFGFSSSVKPNLNQSPKPRDHFIRSGSPTARTRNLCTSKSALASLMSSELMAAVFLTYAIERAALLDAHLIAKFLERRVQFASVRIY